MTNEAAFIIVSIVLYSFEHYGGGFIAMILAVLYGAMGSK